MFMISWCPSSWERERQFDSMLWVLWITASCAPVRRCRISYGKNRYGSSLIEGMFDDNDSSFSVSLIGHFIEKTVHECRWFLLWFPLWFAILFPFFLSTFSTRVFRLYCFNHCCLRVEVLTIFKLMDFFRFSFALFYCGGRLYTINGRWKKFFVLNSRVLRYLTIFMHRW